MAPCLRDQGRLYYKKVPWCKHPVHVQLSIWLLAWQISPEYTTKRLPDVNTLSCPTVYMSPCLTDQYRLYYKKAPSCSHIIHVYLCIWFLACEVCTVAYNNSMSEGEGVQMWFVVFVFVAQDRLGRWAGSGYKQTLIDKSNWWSGYGYVYALRLKCWHLFTITTKTHLLHNNLT